MKLGSIYERLNLSQKETLSFMPIYGRTRTRGGGRQKIQEEEKGSSGLSSQLN